MTYKYIKNIAEYRTLRLQLKETDRFSVAVDLEGEYNLHIYGEHLCLVQLYTGKDLYLIDPLSDGLAVVKELFEDRFLQKIMFSASSDLALLERGYGIIGKTILDLNFGVEILEFPKKDLHSVLLQALGKAFTKKKKYQTYNWMRRPLDPGAVEYALNDVLHLFALKDTLLTQIAARNAIDRFVMMNQTVQNKSYLIENPQPWKKIKGYRQLRGEQKKKLEIIHIERDKLAKELNQPPNNIIPNAKLAPIAMQPGGLSYDSFGTRVPSKARDRFIRDLNQLLA